MRKLLASAAFAISLLSSVPALADYENDGPPPPRARRVELGVGMHAAWYRPLGFENSFPGIGVSVRHPIDNRITFEASGTYFEAFENSTSGTSVRAYPIQASLIGYIFPHSPIQFYGVAGAGIEGVDSRDELTGRSTHFNRPGGHMGAGAQFNAGRLTFEADWRWVLYANTSGSSAVAAANPHPFQDRDARLFRMGMTLFF